MSFHFIPFSPEHLLFIMDVNENVKDEQTGMDLLTIGKASKEQGPCLTLMNGCAVACGGLHFIFKETASIWVRVSRRAGPHAHYELRGQLYRWIDEYHLDRLQAVAQERWGLDKYFTWLGMEKEGVLRKYGPHGIDQTMYAWIRS